jgi:hypothetical protein
MWGALTILKVAVRWVSQPDVTLIRELRPEGCSANVPTLAKVQPSWSVINSLQGGCRAALAVRQPERCETRSSDGASALSRAGWISTNDHEQR